MVYINTEGVPHRCFSKKMLCKYVENSQVNHNILEKSNPPIWMTCPEKHTAFSPHPVSSILKMLSLYP